MVTDFIASKLKQLLDQTDNPLEFEVQEILLEKYLAGEVLVQFVDGEPLYSLSDDRGVQLELPLDV